MNLRRQRPVPEPLPSPEQHLHEISLLDDHPTPYHPQAPRTRALYIDGWMQDDQPERPLRPTHTALPKPHSHLSTTAKQSKTAPYKQPKPTPCKQPKPTQPVKSHPQPQSPRLHSSEGFRRARSQQLARQIRQEMKGKQQAWQTHFHIRKTQGRSCAKIAEQYYLDHQRLQLEAVTYPVYPLNPEKKRPLRPQVGRIRQLLHSRR